MAKSYERYRIANRQYPEKLEQLMPQFLQKIPHDLINGSPLKYSRSADAQFLLYSVGWNEKDDGGAFPTLEKSGNDFRSWMNDSPETGDWVWHFPVTN